MADTDRIADDAAGQLFDQIEGVHAGMLGIDGSDQHMQPMSPYLDREARAIYFITSSDTDLVKALAGSLGGPPRARFAVVGKKHDYYAGLTGRLTVSDDEAKLDEIWSRVAAAWFEGGREDARVTLLRFVIDEAAVWASTGSALRFGMEIARSNMSKDHKPEVGDHTVIDFRRAA